MDRAVRYVVGFGFGCCLATMAYANSPSNTVQGQQYVSAAAVHAQQQVASSPSASQPTPSSSFGLSSNSRFHLNGFLSVGGATIFENLAPGTAYSIPNHGLIRHGVNTAPLSLVGLQYTANIADHFQAVTQLVGDGDNSNGNVSYRVNVEWAFLRYTLNKNYQIQVGRFRLPAFLYSQTQQVGYSYPWLTLPNEVYRIVPFNNLNGVSVLSSYPLGSKGWSMTVQPYYGSNSSTYDAVSKSATAIIAVPTHFDEDHLTGMVATVSNDQVMIRASYAMLRLSAFLPNTSAPIIDKKRVKFASFASRVSFGKVFIIGEYADRQTPQQIAALRGYYAGVGLKLGQITPMVTYGRIKTTNHPTLEVPQFQQSYTLSIDYTLNSNLDMKGSISQITPQRGSVGLFNQYPNHKRVYLMGLSLDAVF